MVERGKFIVLEGIDGAGTTTQATLLDRYIRKKCDVGVFQTFEPSSLYVGRYIRQILGRQVTKEDGSRYSDRTIAALFLADRWVHTESEIVPALEQGRHVVCDRYYLSSFAYQSIHGQALDTLITMHTGLISPDLTLFLDINAEVGAKRRAGRSGDPEIYEVDDFQRRVVEQYHAAIEKIKDREKIVVLNGEQSLLGVTRAIRQEVNKLLQ